MAKFNEILVGRYNRFAQKLLAMKGPVPAPQLASEVSLALNLFHGKEVLWHQGWQLFGDRQAPTGGVGQFAGWQIRNPSSQNSIMVIEKLAVGSTTAQTVQLTFTQGGTSTDLTTVNTATRRAIDLRHSGTSSAIISTTTNVAGLGSSPGALLIPANDSRDFINNSICEWVLAPGDALRLGAFAANTQLEILCWWRERFLEDSERT